LKRVVRTRQASQDIEAAIAYYLSEADTDLAESWLDEFDTACTHIAQFPGTGSPRYAKRSAVKGLRFWLLNRFPYSVFYIERREYIEIIRVLHQATDIPQHLKTKTP
jgi:toxin ParE1/3/4